MPSLEKYQYFSLYKGVAGEGEVLHFTLIAGYWKRCRVENHVFPNSIPSSPLLSLYSP